MLNHLQPGAYHLDVQATNGESKTREKEVI
jgi:hypothetical protein